MTTATAESGAGSAPAPAPAPIADLPDSGSFDGDTLSAEEEAYFESGGEKLDGLDGEGGEGGAAEPAPKVAAKAPAKGKDAAKAEPAEGDGGEGEVAAPAAADARPKTVPHAALHEEREGHKATKAERQAALERAVKAEAKLQMIAEAFQARRAPEEAAPAAPPAPEPMPDPQKDIFGALDWAVKQIGALQTKLGETEKTTGEQIKQTREQQEAHQNHIALKNAYDNDARAFWQQNPDFAEAYHHLQHSRANELMLLGHDPEKIPQILYNEEMSIAANYLGNRKSAAEAIYKLAQGRGYVPKKAADPEPAPAADAKPAPKKPTAADEIANIERGQAAARTLSNTGGGAGDTLTGDALVAMSEEEFERVVGKMSDAEWRKYAGG